MFADVWNGEYDQYSSLYKLSRRTSTLTGTELSPPKIAMILYKEQFVPKS